MLMSNFDSITPLPLDPELLGRSLEKLPVGVIEQVAHNWREIAPRRLVGRASRRAALLCLAAAAAQQKLRPTR
jgi:hypothetical protein